MKKTARTMKRTVAVFLAILMAVLTVPFYAVESTAGAPATWESVADTTMFDDDPNAVKYYISTAEQLAGMAKLVNSGERTFSGQTIILTADIDLGGKEWVPIDKTGDLDCKLFGGILDGNGHAIKNMTITKIYQENGLFGRLDGSVENLKLLNVYIEILSTEKAIGSIAGGIYANNTHINNCTVTGVIYGTIKSTNIGKLYYQIKSPKTQPFEEKNNNCTGLEIKVGSNEFSDTSVKEFHIKTAADLVGVSKANFDGNTFVGQTIYLDNDIDLSNIGEWTPIGDFNGTFNGQGHSIIGMNITDDHAYTGFIGMLSGTVSNLSVAGTIKCDKFNDAGMIAGYCKGNGSIQNCDTFGSIELLKGSYNNDITTDDQVVYYFYDGYVDYANLGGVVGCMIDGSVTNCRCFCSSITAPTNKGRVGGICGRAIVNGSDTNGIKISNCYVGATELSGFYLGGILGACFIHKPAKGRIINVFLENCAVSENTKLIGTTVVPYDNLHGTYEVGGLIGSVAERADLYNMGTTPDNVHVYIRNSYSSAAITAQEQKGKVDRPQGAGLVGDIRYNPGSHWTNTEAPTIVWYTIDLDNCFFFGTLNGGVKLFFATFSPAKKANYMSLKMTDFIHISNCGVSSSLQSLSLIGVKSDDPYSEEWVDDQAIIAKLDTLSCFVFSINKTGFYGKKWDSNTTNSNKGPYEFAATLLNNAKNPNITWDGVFNLMKGSINTVSGESLTDWGYGERYTNSTLYNKGYPYLTTPSAFSASSYRQSKLTVNGSGNGDLSITPFDQLTEVLTCRKEDGFTVRLDRAYLMSPIEDETIDEYLYFGTPLPKGTEMYLTTVNDERNGYTGTTYTYTVTNDSTKKISLTDFENINSTNKLKLTPSSEKKTAYDISIRFNSTSNLVTSYSSTLEWRVSTGTSETYILGKPSGSISFNTDKEFDITVNVNGNGKCTGTESLKKVPMDESRTVNIVPDTGNKIASISMNKTALTTFPSEGTQVKFENIEADQQLDVKFVPITYKVSLASGAGYAMTSDQDTTVGFDGNFTFGISIDSGYWKSPNFQVAANGVALTADENGKYTLTNIESNQKITVTGLINDVNPPTTAVSFASSTASKWSEFLNTVSLGLFRKGSETVTVTASDAESGIAKAEYLISDTPFANESDVAGTWTELQLSNGTGSFDIKANQKAFVYVRVTDNAGISKIINSDGLVVYTDSAPITTEITYTKQSGEDKTFMVALNGNTVKSVSNGSETINAGKYSVTSGGQITLKNSYIETLEAGTYTLSVQYNPLGEKYVSGDAPAETTVTLNVIKIDGAVNIKNDISKIYDGSAVNAPEYTASGTGAVTVEYAKRGTSDYSTAAPTDAGEYTVRVSVAADGNYTEASATADFTISSATGVVAIKNDISKTYDGNAVTEPKYTVSGTGVVTVEYAKRGTSDYSTAAPTDAGEYTVRVSAADDGNHTEASTTADFTIGKKDVTVNVAVKDKIFDGTTAAEFDGTPQLVGIIEGDDVSLVNGVPTFAKTAADKKTAVNFTDFTLEGKDAGNYNLIQPKGITATVTAAAVTETSVPKTGNEGNFILFMALVMLSACGVAATAVFDRRRKRESR